VWSLRRYARRSDKQKIAEHFHVHGPSIPDFGPSWNVAPQTFQPVLRLNRDTGELEIVMMRWGLVPYWSKFRRPRESFRSPVGRFPGPGRFSRNCSVAFMHVAWTTSVENANY
jgi:putative SOS response-associated peptidase YedK